MFGNVIIIYKEAWLVQYIAKSIQKEDTQATIARLLHGNVVCTKMYGSCKSSAYVICAAVIHAVNIISNK